jgi:hypothetical protein
MKILFFLILFFVPISDVKFAEEVSLSFVSDENWFNKSIPVNLKIISKNEIVYQKITSVQIHNNIVVFQDNFGPSSITAEKIFIEADGIKYPLEEW